MGRDLTQTCVSSETIYTGKILRMRRDMIRLGSGAQTFERVVVDHPGAVVVVPITAGGEVLLVRQYRYAVGEALLECVAGTREAGEDPAECAAREIQEEAGVRAGKLTRLAEFYTAPGFCTEKLHLFLAEELTESRLPGDEDEEIDVVRLPLAEAVAMAQRGEFRDAKTIIGLLLAAAHR